MKYLLLPAFLFVAGSQLRAEDCTGYIIKNTKDTVRGMLDIPVSKKEILFADMWTTVKFAEGTGKPKKMDAGDIAGFGFQYLGQWYHYEVLDMQKNSGKKAPKLLGKFVNDFRFFLLRVDDRSLPIYREYWNSESERKIENPGSGRTTTIVGKEVNIELYVKNKEGVFVEIAPTTLGGQKKLKAFLRDWVKLEDEFLQTVDDKARFDEAEEILKKYNDWKAKR